MVSVRNVSKTFSSRKKKVKALDRVSFQAKPGEIFGLLGPNGAGKTTALRIVSTLLKPDEGEVEVNGFSTVRKAYEVRKRIGFLTSDMRLSGNLSSKELIYFFGDLNRVSRETTRKRMKELSDYLEMGDFLERSVDKLSTGMKQKAAIAVSLIHDPEVIVFDEPTNGLDIITSKTVTDFLKDFRKRGKTVIISTHVMAVAEKLCDSVGIILEGKIVENDTLEGMLKRHSTSNLEDVFFSVAEKEGVLKDA